jgi:hypothetical protein
LAPLAAAILNVTFDTSTVFPSAVVTVFPLSASEEVSVLELLEVEDDVELDEHPVKTVLSRAIPNIIAAYFLIFIIILLNFFLDFFLKSIS